MRFMFRSLAAIVLACHFIVATAAGADKTVLNIDVLPVIPMQHASWSAAAGAPTGIYAITQTLDGWLWIGSSAGLFRFDGVRFLRAEGALAPLTANIFDLGTLADGTLWVTYRFGGMSLLKDGHMRHFAAGKLNTPGGTLFTVGQDGAGRIWLASGQGLRVLAADGTWTAPPAALGAPAGLAMAMLLDRSGTFWLRGSDAVYALAKQGAQFVQKDKIGGAGKFAQHPDGSVWTSDESPGLRMVQGAPGADPKAWAINTLFANIVFDAGGALWSTGISGITRDIPTAVPRAHRVDAEHGLSGRHGLAVFEDREQNIWVGTENGLDRFRPYRLQPLALPHYRGEAQALAPGAQGGAWVDVSFVASAKATPAQFAPESSAALLTTALHTAPDGTVWSGGRGGIWKMRDGKREAVGMPPGITDPMATPTLSLTTDTAGTLWVSLGRKGVFSLKDGTWTAHGGVAGLADFPTTALASDAQGRTWFGSTGDQIRLLDKGAVRRFGRDDGLAIGTVLAVVPTPHRVWVGGENGLAYFDGKRFIPVTGHGGEPFAGTSGIVPDADGTLWLNGGTGISLIAPDELRATLRQPGRQVRFNRLDYRDGLVGTAAPIIPLPSAIRSTDGTLWFSTTGGVVAFDPARLPKNPLVPPVVVTAIKAGGKDYAAVDGLRLAPGTRALDVEFAALSYRAPERVGFRYRLDGVDSDWHNADGRRSAQYTNLAPGQYRFRVIAANDDGLWNTAGTTLTFSIAPSLTQTLWFRVLCGAAVLGALWLLYRMRLRLLARRIAAQMNTRIDERERIARELHDTLLQSIMGLVLKVGAAVQRLRVDERKPLEDALATARQVLGEGRDRVAGLRGASLQHAGLARAIDDFGTALAQDSGIAFALAVKGTAVRLDDAVSEELLAIAREAVWNAFVHAQPRHVTVTLGYSARGVGLTVADDGCGIPAEVQGGRVGHWGLPGLRERAAKIGATLELTSSPGAGTTWTLALPREHATAAK